MLPNDDRGRVLLLRNGPRHLIAVRPDPPELGSQWRAVPAHLVQAVAEHLGTPPAQGASARVFELNPDDVHAWDTAHHFTRDGWTYGVNSEVDGRTRSWASFRELHGPATASPPVDPVAVATAVAVANIQAQLAELTELAEQIAATVETVLGHQRREQEGDVLAAAEIVADVHDRYATNGTLDPPEWDRLASLELTIRSQHRQLLAELTAAARHLAFTTPTGARVVLREPVANPDRVADVVELAWRNIAALHQWTEMHLQAMSDQGTLTPADLTSGEAALRQYVDEVRVATAALTDINSAATFTPWYRVLVSKETSRRGLPAALAHERTLVRQATRQRTTIAEIARAYTAIPALPGPERVRMLFADADPTDLPSSGPN